MALGCLTISFVTLIVHWLYGGKPPMKAISGLGRISANLMGGYVAIKFAEIFASGEGPLLVQGGWDSINFWFEVFLGSVIPIIYLAQKRFRESPSAVFWVSLCAIAGMSLNRVNVAGLATLSLTKTIYFPAWTEWVMAFGILAGAGLFYLFCVEYFGLYEGLRRERAQEWITPAQFDHTDWKTLYFGGQRFGSVQMYSLVFILAAAASFGLVSNNAVFGISPDKTEVKNPRRVQITKTGGKNGTSANFVLADKGGNPHSRGNTATVMMLDGNRNGRYVLFDHEQHQARYDGEKSCVLCHHMNKPFDQYTGCYECHNDMYLAVDIFDHDLHVNKLGGNEHCSRCHTDVNLAKVRANTKDCLECHQSMAQHGARVAISSPTMNSKTVGYMDAAHGLCISCHKEVQNAMTVPNENISRCVHCHQSLPDTYDKAWERHL
jgi:hypothetical protein